MVYRSTPYILNRGIGVTVKQPIDPNFRKSIREVLSFQESDPFVDNITSIQVDSRNTTPGTLFFALKGAQTDGHEFLQDAVEKGAIGLVVSKDYEGPIPKNITVIKVLDGLSTLQKIAQVKLQLASPKIAAITGSVGKTTTKEFAKTLVGVEKKVFSPSGNMNSQIGLALAIVNGPVGDEEWYVLEMGMTHPGNILRLVDIAPPDIALVTSIHYVHSQNFSDLSGIAKAKAEIFASQQTRVRILNRAANQFDLLVSTGSCPYKTYSLHEGQNSTWHITRENGVIHCFEENKLVCKVPDPIFPALHVYDNLLAAISIAREAGISWQGISQGIQRVSLPKQRLEIASVKGVTFINDSYNASEPSMVAGLEVLHETAKKQNGRSVAILGQMRELGNFSEECHFRVGLKAAEMADYVFCLGEEAKPIYEVCQKAGVEVFWTTSFSELFSKCTEVIREGDTVLLKGSRSNQLWRVLEGYSL